MTVTADRHRRTHRRPRHLLGACALTAVLAVAGCGSSNADSASPAQTDAESNRTLVLDFYNRFFNRHEIDAASVIAEDYIQHNPLLPDGKAAFLAVFEASFAANPNSKATVERSAVDADLVYVHAHSTTNPDGRGQAVVDIFRVDDGAIVEHWDVIQPVPETAANSNTMF